MKLKKFKLGKKIISNKHKTYFIADIAANHDGNLNRAKKLIKLCALAGADAAKFQHFKAETIVSKYGFEKIGKLSHQDCWSESVFNTYKKASIDFKWTLELKKVCDEHNIDFMTSPYDLNYVDAVNKFICAYKIGSGDISWTEIIDLISKKNKPVILATGASNIADVKKAVNNILKLNNKLVLMQCNTNYTNSIKNYKYINLNVLNQYKETFKNKVIYGLSDHTPGHTTVLGAIALGARVIEKHFTDDNGRDGPDHKFSMNFNTWKLMVEQARFLEQSLGDGNKKIEKNEKQTFLIQRRGIYAKKNIYPKKKINKSDLICLRPCNRKIFSAQDFNCLLGRYSKKLIKKGEWILKKNIK